MTNQFTELLNKSAYVSLSMDLSYIICFVVMLYLAFKGKLKTNTIFISVLITFIFSQFTFETWWYFLNESASNTEDSKWLADHDGGGVIGIFIINCFKAFLCLILSFLVAKTIAKRKGLGITKKSTEFVPNR